MPISIPILAMLAGSTTFGAAFAAGWTISGSILIAVLSGNLMTGAIVVRALLMAARGTD